MSYSLSTINKKTINLWKNNKDKLLFIIGDSYSGKTTLARDLLKDYHIIELNTDLDKCKGCIKEYIHSTLYRKDIFMMLQTNKNYKALLIDDLHLFNKYDKKSLSRLNDTFKTNNYVNHPIIVTCDTTTSKIINLIKSTAYIVLLPSKTKLSKTKLCKHSISDNPILYSTNDIQKINFTKELSIKEAVRIFTSENQMISLNILENVSSMVYKKDLISILSKIYESICISDNLESTYYTNHENAIQHITFNSCVIPYKILVNNKKNNSTLKYNSYISKSLIQIHNQTLVSSLPKLLFTDDIIFYIYLLNYYSTKGGITIYHWLSIIHKINKIDIKILEKQLKVFNYYYKTNVTRNKLTKILNSIV